MLRKTNSKSGRLLLYLIVGIILALAWAFSLRAAPPAGPVKEAGFDSAPVKLPFIELGVFDPLPPEVLAMPPEFRVRWVKAYNEEAYRQAAIRAEAYNARQKFNDTHVQASSYHSRSHLDQVGTGDGYGNSSIGARSTTGYDGTTSQRTFYADRWGGGSITILNPYATQTINGTGP